MKTSFFLIATVLSFIFSLPCTAVKNAQNSISPVVGYRQDNIKWSLVNGPSGEWKNPQFIEYGIAGNRFTWKDRYVISYDITVANLLSGRFQDNGYLHPGQNASLSAERVWSLAFRPNLGLGYKFKPARYLSIIPQLGFLYDLLYLKTKTNNTGSFSDFKDTIQWYGPWLGVDTTTKLAQRWTMTAGAAYQLAFFNNSGNWKLPPSQLQNTMNQSGTGQSVAGRIRIAYEIVKSVSLGGEANGAWKWLNSGNDTRRFGNAPTIKGKLNKVHTRSFGGRLTLTKDF